MKFIKILLALIVLLVVAATVGGFLAPQHVFVQRNIQINAEPEVIHAEVNNLKRWSGWSPWHKKDTAMKIIYSGPESGAGASYTWSSDNSQVGNGDLTVTSSNKDSIAIAMNFMEGNIGYACFNFQEKESGTYVTWTMRSDMGGNPFSRLMGLFMDKFVGPDFESGLASLKQLAESAPPAPKEIFAITEEELAERIYIIVKDSMAWDSIASFYANKTQPLIDAVTKSKLEITGHTSGIYFMWDETTASTVMAIGIPVAGSSAASVKGYQTYSMSAGKTLLLKLTGGYSALAAAHEALDKYMSEHNLLQGVPVIEEYVVGPGQEPDSNKWVTNIYYPVK